MPPAGTGQGMPVAVLRRAEVDRRPAEDPEIERPGDDEVVGPIRDVAEGHDDHEEPEGGLREGPAPAFAVEQAEQRAAVDGSTGGQRLGHRYSTVRVPVIAGIGWTEQMKVYVPASRAV